MLLLVRAYFTKSGILLGRLNKEFSKDLPSTNIHFRTYLDLYRRPWGGEDSTHRVLFKNTRTALYAVKLSFKWSNYYWRCLVLLFFFIYGRTPKILCKSNYATYSTTLLLVMLQIIQARCILVIHVLIYRTL